MQHNTPMLLVLSPALPAVEAVAYKKAHPEDPYDEYDPGFLGFYKYFQELMHLHKLPYVDFLQNVADYSKAEKISSLYANNGKDIHHYSPQCNRLLVQAIAERMVLAKVKNNP